MSHPVPRAHDQLVRLLHDLPATVLAFTFLMWCWSYHYKRFRRFGRGLVLRANREVGA